MNTSKDKPQPDHVIQANRLNLWYGTFQALFEVDLDIKQGMITSLIGPSGCGKSTFLRSINRINERLGYVRIDGGVKVFGQNIYDPEVELIQLRKQVGMVFQRPNPLPVSIRENVLFGHQSVTGRTAEAVHRPTVAGQAPCLVDG
ncbi:Phosphate transport ATP-binding protein PstB (TC 3.A.1.7.1) [hydrothermal vent metagenome]|uniref:Phosphate transport ATP-binding protein PstB (TC 3.A.1.7.1) n=1 Tax=hydrothermal vent metagenome TaxID=652676 RepID=A0A3B1BHZ6_9ZZZZ